MAQTIKLKRTATPNNVPTTAQLELGEIAVNTYDGKVYIKKNDGAESIVEVTASSLGNYLPLTGGTLTGGLTITANEGREVESYLPSSYTTNDIVAGHRYGWYDDNWYVGMSRSGDSAGEAFRFKFNTAYVAQVGTTGVFDGTGYRIGTTTVIDSSRNLTNIGTISSGAITATSTTNAVIAEYNATNYSALRYDGVDTVVGGDGVYRRGGSEKLRLTSSGINVTGTISSGAITSSGQLLVDTDTEHQIKIDASSASGASMHLNTAGAYAYTVYQNSDRVWRIGAYGGSSFTIRDHTGDTSPLVINSSGNATFSGTISSGAITSSGPITVNNVNDTYNFKAVAGDTDSWFGVYDDANNSANIIVTRSDGATSFLHLGHSGATTINGTLSSGAITSTGILTLSADTADTLNFSASSSNTLRGISFQNWSALTASTDGYLRLNGNSEFSNGVYTPANFRADGSVRGASYTVGATEVIDSSRNITAGAISSGAIAASGDITTQGWVQHTGVLYSRNTLNVLNTAGNGWSAWATRGNDTFNLNVGTISSGAHTIYTQASTLEGINLVANVSSANQNSDSPKIQFNGEYQDNGPYIQGDNVGSYGYKSLKFYTNRNSGTDYTTAPTVTLTLDFNGNAQFSNNVSAASGIFQGNVGIGVTEPSKPLDISGGMRASGSGTQFNSGFATGTAVQINASSTDNSDGLQVVRGSGSNQGSGLLVTSANYTTGSKAFIELNAGIYGGSSTQYLHAYDNTSTKFLMRGDGAMGILTDSPTAQLDVRGNVRIGDGTSSEQDILFSAGGGEWQVGTNSAGNGTNNNQFYVYDSAYRFTVQKGTGNVGISTDQPTNRFHVKYNVNATIANLAEVNDYSAVRIGNFRADGDHNLYIGYMASNSVGLQARDSTASGTAQNILINPYGGLVGIGTTAPQSVGSGYGALTIGGSTGGGIIFNSQGSGFAGTWANTNGYVITAFGARHITLKTNDVDRFKIESNGTVKIGAYEGAQELMFRAANNSTSTIRFNDNNDSEGTYIRAVGQPYGGDIKFGARWDDDEDKMIIRTLQSSAGGAYDVRVGIGTVTPSNTLEVNGGTTIGGQLRVNTSNWPTTTVGDSGGRHIFGGSSEPTVILWNEATPAANNYSTLFIGSKSANSATTFGGGFIRGGIENTSDSDGFLKFFVSYSANSNFQALHIDSDGNFTANTVGYNANRRFIFRNGNNPVPVAYDTFVVTSNDVPCISIVEASSGDQSTEQQLKLAVGDNDAVISTSATVQGGLHLRVGRGTNQAGYLKTNGNAGIHIENGGAVNIGGTSGVKTTIKNTLNLEGWATTGGESRDTAIYIGRDGTATSAEYFTIGFKTTARSGEQIHPTTGPYNGGTALYIECGSSEAGGICLDQDSVHVYGSSDGGATFRVIDKDADVVTFEMLQTSWDGVFRGNVIAYGSMSSISDRRIKTDIKPIGSVLDKINKLGVYSYKKITAPHDREEIGVMAQEIQEQFPELVTETEVSNPAEVNGLESILTVDYEHLTAVLLKGMQEQQQQINHLTKIIEDMKNGND